MNSGNQFTPEQMLNSQVIFTGGPFGNGTVVENGYFRDACPVPQKNWTDKELQDLLSVVGGKYSNLQLTVNEAREVLNYTARTDQRHSIDDVLKSVVLKAALNDASGKLPMNAEYAGSQVKFQGDTLGALIMDANNNIDGRSTVIDEGYIKVLNEVLRGNGYDRSACNIETATPTPNVAPTPTQTPFSETSSIAISPPKTGDGGYLPQNHGGNGAEMVVISLALMAGIIASSAYRSHNYFKK